MKVLSCEACGKEDPNGNLVRQCCAWEGNRTLCEPCRMAPEGVNHTPGHVCGRGIEGRTE